MKKNISHFLLYFLSAICVLFFQAGCKKDDSTITYTIQKPIYKLKSSVLAEINGNASQAIINTGKIYIKDNFIFLNEIDKGIHIINNSNPSNPVQTAFLNIPGNQDIAVKGNTLYADMYSDLLAINISDVRHVTISKVLHNFFIGRSWINGNAVDSNLVITGWITKDTTVPKQNSYASPWYAYSNNGAQMADAAVKSTASGTAGSMARMVLMNNYLYAITESHTVGVINVSNAAAPRATNIFLAGFDLETIYPFKDKLFLGSSTGLFIYDVSDPENPVKSGEFSHGRACDPVVTDGNYAYVTLHTGSKCGGNLNELNVIDIKDLMNPALVKTYAMTSPGGLSKDGNLLFVCDGNSGVKVYNAADPADLKFLKQIEAIEPYDVITGNNHALVVAKDGLYQYDYSNVSNIRKLSVITVKRKP